MPSIRIGAKSRVLIAAENGTHTPMSTEVGHIIPIGRGSTIGPTEEGYQPDEIQPNPNPTRTEEGIQKSEGTIVQAVENESFGLLCYWFFGGYAVSGAGPYEHVFTIDGSTPTTLRVEVGETTQSRFDQMDGMVLTGLQFQAAKESAMCTATWTLGGTGKYTLNATSSLDASPTTYTEPRHSKRNLTVAIDGSSTALVTMCDVTINRPHVRLEALDGNPYAADVHQGMYEITVELEGFWDQADTIRGLADGADHTLRITSPNPGTPAELIDIYFPEVRFYHVSAPGIPDDQPAKIKVQGKPYYLDASEGSSIEITIDNDVATYAATAVQGTA